MLDYDIAEIDANSKLKNLGWVGVQRALEFYSTPDSLHGARKLSQEPVSGCLEQTSLMLGQLGFNQLMPKSFDPGEGALVVLPHQARVPDYVRCENRCKTPLNLLVGRIGHLSSGN